MGEKLEGKVGGAPKNDWRTPMNVADVEYLAQERGNKLNPYMLHDGKPLPLDHPDSNVKNKRLKGLLFKEAEQIARAKQEAKKQAKGDKKPLGKDYAGYNILKGNIGTSHGQARRNLQQKPDSKPKAKGGYVKKYARGGGVLRKAR